MGVVTGRLLFLAFVGLTGVIIYNALYLQDQPGSSLAKAMPKPQGAERAPMAPVTTDLPPLEAGGSDSQLVLRAVQRELAVRGYDVGAADGKPSDKTEAAISAYQHKHGLPVTGAASEELLRHILLGDSAGEGATGSLALGGQGRQDLEVKAVQQILADLGYAPGPIDGSLGESTKRAILAFQRDRKLAETGRITPELVAELKRVTGGDPAKTAARR